VTKTELKAEHLFNLLLASVLVASFLLAWPAQAQTEPEVSVTQTAAPGPAIVGQPHTFTVTVTNNSDPQLVGLKNFLSPADVQLVSATPSQGTCGISHHDNGVDCTLGEIPSGGSATVHIVATPTVPGTMTSTTTGQAQLTPAGNDQTTVTVDPAPEPGAGEAHEGHLAG
jgi:hypothetical protein